MASVKKRGGNAATQNEGINYLRDITGREGHIFRGVLEEDVAIDAHIELCRHGDEPCGLVVAPQVKSGESYIHAEDKRTFTFHPREADLRYWQSFALPVYLIVSTGPLRGIHLASKSPRAKPCVIIEACL